MTRHLRPPATGECTCDTTACAPCDEQRLFYLFGVSTPERPTETLRSDTIVDSVGAPSSRPSPWHADGASDADVDRGDPLSPVHGRHLNEGAR